MDVSDSLEAVERLVRFCVKSEKHIHDTLLEDAHRMAETPNMQKLRVDLKLELL